MVAARFGLLVPAAVQQLAGKIVFEVACNVEWDVKPDTDVAHYNFNAYQPIL